MLNGITNNKILENSLSDAFLRSVQNNLLPLIRAKYGSEETDIFMYEDLLWAKLLADGFWHYPLTVLIGGEAKIEWIRWSVTADGFKDKNPYSYSGDADIEFSLCDAPDAVKDDFKDYVGYSGEVAIKINVEALARDITFLSGRYSQRFVDEMSRQISQKISSLMSCEGLDSSSLSLLLAFAPESYFEHTSENVTYRRLLLIDKGAQPRDFWVKWTRLNSAVGYSVSDAVSANDIEFDIGEDVPQKIREKEYRFLLREGRDKYQSAMGRKNVTEWREIIRRAIKRGELSRVEIAPAEIVFEDDLSAKLKDVLGAGYTPAPKEDVAEDVPMGEDYIKALEIAKGYIGEASNDGPELELASDEPELEISIDEPGLEVTFSEPQEAEEITVPEPTEESVPWLLDVSEEDAEPEFEVETVKQDDDEPPFEISEQQEPVVTPSPVDIEEVAEDNSVSGEAKIKVIKTWGEVSMKDEPADALREAEARASELGIRLEYEKQMRERLEDEIERLRASEIRLSEENEKLRCALVAEERKRRECEESFKLELARLTAQNEVLAKSEERQKERLATAARDAIERQRMLEEEKRRIEEENTRLAAMKTEQPAPVAEPAPAAVSEPAPISENTPERGEENYTYVSKNVKLLFRRPVDPNVTSRIYEIIKATIEYFGKERVKLRIKASVPDSETVNLEFTSIPMEEMQLLSSIIQVLGSSGLGIAKAIVE